MNPLAAILAAPAAAAAGSLLGAATRTASEAATSFAEALANALAQQQNSSPTQSVEALLADEGERLEELAFELALLTEAAGGSAEATPIFRVTPAAGQIEVWADDPVRQAALERLLAERPDLLEELVIVAKSCCEQCDEGASVELSLDANGELTADTLDTAADA